MNAKQRYQNRRNVPVKGTRVVFDLEASPTGRLPVFATGGFVPLDMLFFSGLSEPSGLLTLNVLKSRPTASHGELFYDMDLTKLEERIAALTTEVK